MNGREMFRQMTNDKQTSKHKLGNRTNRWSKVQADARCPNSKKQLTPKTTSIKRLNIQPTEFIRLVSVHSVRTSKQNMLDGFKIPQKK